MKEKGCDLPQPCQVCICITSYAIPARICLTLLSLALVHTVSSKVQVMIPLSRLSIHTAYCGTTYAKVKSIQQLCTKSSQIKGREAESRVSTSAGMQLSMQTLLRTVHDLCLICHTTPHCKQRRSAQMPIGAQLYTELTVRHMYSAQHYAELCTREQISHST